MTRAGDIYWCCLRSPKATKDRLLQVKVHLYAGQNRRERLVTLNAIGSLINAIRTLGTVSSPDAYAHFVGGAREPTKRYKPAYKLQIDAVMAGC